MKICEEFVSIQGEGKYTGVPSYFVRTSGCSLRCRWGDTVCDTYYTSWSIEKENIYDFNIELCEKSILSNKDLKHIVITGGEPTLWFKDLIQIWNYFKNKGMTITIETNGVTSLDRNLFIHHLEGYNSKLLFSISPKLKSSYPDKDKFPEEYKLHSQNNEYILDNIKFYLCKYQTDELQFKFVIDNVDDIKEVQNIQKECNIPSNLIWLMPQGIDKETLNAKEKWIIKECIFNGFNFSDRLHIKVFGNLRKV
jgi:7-carboxy-7-deazaguanine synthase